MKTTLFAKLEEALLDQIRSNRKLGTPELEECGIDPDAWKAIDQAVEWGYLTSTEEERLIAIATLIGELSNEAKTIAKNAMIDTTRFEGRMHKFL